MPGIEIDIILIFQIVIIYFLPDSRRFKSLQRTPLRNRSGTTTRHSISGITCFSLPNQPPATEAITRLSCTFAYPRYNLHSLFHRYAI
jgi:hypothetical protein